MLIQIIKNILKLHVKNGIIDVDSTYSKGIFYKNNGIQKPKYKFDISPQTNDTVKASADNLPLENESIDCLIFDPPFLATTGKSLTEGDGNIINKRFGVFPSEVKLFEFYVRALKDTYRVLRQNGIMIFKCQDKISSSKQYISHCFVYNEAIKIGFYPKDLFILLAKNRIVADWQLKNQKNARKFHSYFWVFQKNKDKIKYVND